jgi:predicted patatin/cPLA2 family phospholipase
MTIKHIIIAGGGPVGLQFMGAIEYLNTSGFWLRENIESIYATSIGTFIGTFICLNYDWETINKYIIERPWNDVFKLNGKQIMDSFYLKGLYNKKIIETTFKPLLEAKDLSVNTTLKEFYEYSKIEFHLYTFEQNKFEVVDLSYKTHPDLALVQAIFMSSAIPGIFVPTIMDDGCYVDGGIMANYPLSYCIESNKNKNDEKNENDENEEKDEKEENEENEENEDLKIDFKDEILGITFFRDYSKPDVFKNNIINDDSSVLDFAIGFFINAMNYICKNVNRETIKYQLECKNDEHFLTIDVMREAINSRELRRDWIQRGYEDAKVFLRELH